MEPHFKSHNLDYHEDDFCQIELLPRENLKEINQDLNKIEEIKQNHSSPFGFTKIHALQEKKVKAVARKITVKQIEEILGTSSFKKFDSVTSGYGSMRYGMAGSTAYGERGCAIIYERVNNEVEHIWLNYLPTWADELNRNEMERCLTTICKNWNLILVDWRQEVVVDPSDTLLMRSYLIGAEEDDE